MKKMIYLRTNRKNFTQSYKKYFLPAITGLVFVAVFFSFKSSLQSVVFGLVSPLFKAYQVTVLNIKLGASYFKPDFALEKENASLKQELEDLRRNIFDLRVAELENKELREKLSLRKDNFLAASVLLSPPRTPYDSIIIDRGQYDGVVKDQRVLLGDRVALGVIENVSATQATVKLFSAPQQKTESIIERTGAIIELLGEGGGNFRVELPLGSDIKKGDLILLPGLPRRVVAYVAEAKSDDTSSFLVVYSQIPLPLLGNSSLYVEIR